MKYILSALFFSFLVSPLLHSSGRRSPEEKIRVAFLRGEQRIHLKSSSGFEAFDINTSKKEYFESETNFVLTPHDKGIMIGRRSKKGPEIRLVPGDENDFLRVNGRRYRDAVVIINTPSGLKAVNEVGIENYLKGVLPMEVSPRWPFEALKVQAIASRTYAINNRGKFGERGYDLSADIFSQVYGGVEAEDPRSNRAVRQSRGEVIFYENKMSRTYFHSSCGGHTEDINSVWNSNIAYLQGVYCPYCSDSPRRTWKLELSPQRISAYLNAAGHDTGEIKSINLLKRTGSGRVESMEIVNSSGRLEMSGHVFRMALGPNLIRSALFTISKSEDPFTFYGRGWGHGVGICQWGSRGMALKGKRAKEIIEYYMPGARIRKLY